jgi:hypothetical protein
MESLIRFLMTTFRTFAHTLLGAIFMAALTGCDPMSKTIRNVDDLKDTTRAMSNTTDRLVGSTEAMSGITTQMSGTTTELRDMTAQLSYDGRDGLTISGIQAALDAAKSANDLQIKVEKATLYFGLLPFQRWTPAQETPQQREVLLWRATQLFFGHVQPLIVDSFPIDNPIETNNSNDWNTLGALSIGLSYIDVEQWRRVQGTEHQPQSVYDLLVTTLSRRAEVTAQGERAALWAREILQNEDQAWYLLQVRQAFFPVMILAKLTDNDDRFFGWSWSSLNLFHRPVNRCLYI